MKAEAEIRGVLFAVAVLAAAICAPPLSAAPGVALIGQVGDPAPGDRLHVMLLLKSIEGGELGDSYAFFGKQGQADAAGAYQLLGIVEPTTDVLGIQAILNQAAAAGYDLEKLSAALPGSDPLEERLSAALLAVSKDGSAEERRELLAATQLPAAMAMGRAFIAMVPAATPSTFEVRRYSPAGLAQGKVEGRVTTGTAPEILPAPENLTERSGDAPRDHFRASVIWTQPEALRRKLLHWQGFDVICAERQAWRDQFAQDPPVTITRAALLAAMQGGFAERVNDLPVLPGDDVTTPIPADAAPYFTHDFPQGDEPPDGTQFMYWVWASDYFCRPGHPSDGVLITFCDRKPPSVPSRLRASRAHTYPGDGTGGSYIKLRWQGAPVEEVARYFVYASKKHDAGMEEMMSNELDPISPSLIGTVENTGDAVVQFPPDGEPVIATQFPEGETWHFWLRCEDNAVCKKNGFGNLSGVTASVPAFLPIIRVAGRPSGRTVVTCCNLSGDPGGDIQLKTTGALDEHLTLRAQRPGPGFGAVEFREMSTRLSFGVHHFAPGANTLEANVAFEGLEGTVEIGARFFTTAGRPVKFRLPGGDLIDWLSFSANVVSLDLLIATWQPTIECQTVALSLCPQPIDPVDPGTGEILPVCIEFSKTPDAETWHAYKRVGFDGEISKFDSGGFDNAGQAVAKDSNFPTRGGSICYLLQFFDKDGNASPIVPVDWVQRASKVPLPRPSIVACTRVGDEQQDLTAFCPREGVERLEWKICPAPPGAANTTTEAFLDNGVLKYVSCAFVDSPRLESDYQSDASQFVQRFDLFKGTNYRVRVRAVGPGAEEEREFGLWSEEKVIAWPIEAPLEGPKVPWPAREVPGVSAHKVRAVFDNVGQLLCVRIGTIPRDAGAVIPTGSSGIAEIPGQSVEQYLNDPRHFVIYLRPEGAKSTGKELQVTHYVQEFLTQDAGPDRILIIDKSIVVKPDPDVIAPPGSSPLYHIWYRIHQPVIQGRAYSCSIVWHGEDREPLETTRTNIVTIPTP